MPLYCFQTQHGRGTALTNPGRAAVLTPGRCSLGQVYDKQQSSTVASMAAAGDTRKMKLRGNTAALLGFTVAFLLALALLWLARGAPWPF